MQGIGGIMKKTQRDIVVQYERNRFSNDNLLSVYELLMASLKPAEQTEKMYEKANEFDIMEELQ